MSPTRRQVVAGAAAPAVTSACWRSSHGRAAHSVQLHELYFGNVGDADGPQGAVARRLGEAFGSPARFEERFRLACSGLFGGSGWVILRRDLCRYVDAFWQNVDWAVVSARLERADAMARAAAP